MTFTSIFLTLDKKGNLMFNVVTEVPQVLPQESIKPAEHTARNDVIGTFNSVFKRYQESDLISHLKNKDKNGEHLTPDEAGQLVGMHLLESALQRVAGGTVLNADVPTVSFQDAFNDTITHQNYTRESGVPVQRLIAYIDTQLESAQNRKDQMQIDSLTKEKEILMSNSKQIIVPLDKPQEEHAWVQQKIAESSQWGTLLSQDADFPILLDQEAQNTRVLTLPEVSIPVAETPVVQSAPDLESKVPLDEAGGRVDKITQTNYWKKVIEETVPLVAGIIPESLPKVEVPVVEVPLVAEVVQPPVIEVVAPPPVPVGVS